MTLRPKFEVVEGQIFSPDEGPRAIDVAVDVGSESVMVEFAERDGNGSAVEIRGGETLTWSHTVELDRE